MKKLKHLLAQFYAKKTVKLADEEWEKKDMSNELMDDWLNNR